MKSRYDLIYDLFLNKKYLQIMYFFLQLDNRIIWYYDELCLFVMQHHNTNYTQGEKKSFTLSLYGFSPCER